MNVPLRSAVFLAAACTPALAEAQANSADAGQSPPEKAVALFTDANITGALAVLKECAPASERCRVLTGKVREWLQLYKKLEEIDDSGTERLLRLDRDISGGTTSKAGRIVGIKRASWLCKQASAELAAARYREAALAAKNALDADPRNPCANRLASEAYRQYLAHADGGTRPYGDFPPYAEPYVHGVEPQK